MNRSNSINNFFLLTVIFLSVVLPSGIVLALSANYNKLNGESIPVAQWNNLATDFLAKSGNGDGTMGGDLSLGNKHIMNVPDPVNPGDIASGQYVTNLISSVAGGDTFVHWGRDECPTDTVRLYGGFGFGSSRGDYGGGTNVMCMEKGSAGVGFFASEVEEVYPLVTSPFNTVLPSVIPTSRFLPCAVCYRGGASCYIKYQDNACDGLYTPAYIGYVLGTHKAPEKNNFSARKRICVDQNFQTVTIPASTPVSSPARLTGTIIDDNFGLAGFDEKKFIRCTVCCN